jgi:flavodoxin
MENTNLKIAIIIHSKTGNTKSVGERIKEKLVARGHQVQLEEIVASNDEEMALAKVILTKCPESKGYDGYVFGAPVRAFSLSPIMKAYLSKMQDLEGKPVYCFLTQHFRFRFLGGDNALKRFELALNEKSARILGTNIVNWKSKKRAQLIEETVDLVKF